ncbi:MAG: 5-bromo-4-chloroindolyl phosphate hydrolysis family protein [Oscillospiraceae bacterium]|nr:5-bromo-4-chloroindolyl phosphate hydrolysis family protein [Oscillospiraceae bacterium]
MREIKRRSAVPVYIAAGVYALYALIFPLYSSWHFLIAAVVTAAAWLIADWLIKPVVEYIPEPEEPEPEPVSHGAETDAILAEAKTARREMERLSASIGDETVRQRIARLIALSDQIAQDAIQDPNDIPQIKKFQGYFLPSTVQLLNAYDRMASLGTEGENITATKQRIAEMLDTEITAFEKQLDALYKNDYLDIDADVQVMHNLLRREGLLQDDELQQLLKKTKE